MFGAFKSKGFNLEENKLSEDYKIEKPIPYKKELYRIKSVLINVNIKRQEFSILLRILNKLFRKLQI